jgi:hypothetical protein
VSDWGMRPVSATSVNHTRVCARRRRLVQCAVVTDPVLYSLQTFEPDLRSEGEGNESGGVVCNNSRMQEFRTHNVI